MALNKKDEAAVRDATYYAVALHQDGKEIRFHEDYDLVKNLIGIHRVMERIIPSKAPLFRWHEHPKKSLPVQWGDGRIKPVTLGKALMDQLPMNIDALKIEFPERDFHPLVKLFGDYSVELHWNATSCLKGDFNHLNRLVEKMRREGRDKAFQNRRDKRLASIRDATKGLRKITDEVFHRCGSSLVVRLDLSYRIDKWRPSRFSVKDPTNLISNEQSRAHREAFIRFLKRKYPLPLLMYAWKKERGRCTSYQYRLLLFFAGDVPVSGYVVGNEIGQHWVNDITGGEGSFNNCNAGGHQQTGIGLINRWETEKIKALKEIVIPRLTMSDYYIRVISKGRIYQPGGLPPKPRRAPGRPRKYRPLASPGVKDCLNKPLPDPLPSDFLKNWR
ncbi:MAG: inovirus Gp2 family protein [Rhodanobacter sp.]|nr:MAG: inovirus Gp2 family protein [Rhodanobacter sp.]